MGVIQIHFSTASARKKPQAGDLRWLKGKKIWQIRQQVRHGNAWVVSNGRPVWEWVQRGSESDRAWQSTAQGSDENDMAIRAYFEAGCLCIIAGTLPILPKERNAKAFQRYMAGCTCSRHPEFERETDRA